MALWFITLLSFSVGTKAATPTYLRYDKSNFGEIVGSSHFEVVDYVSIDTSYGVTEPPGGLESGGAFLFDRQDHKCMEIVVDLQSSLTLQTSFWCDSTASELIIRTKCNYYDEIPLCGKDNPERNGQWNYVSNNNTCTPLIGLLIELCGTGQKLQGATGFEYIEIFTDDATVPPTTSTTTTPEPTTSSTTVSTTTTTPEPTTTTTPELTTTTTAPTTTVPETTTTTPDLTTTTTLEPTTTTTESKTTTLDLTTTTTLEPTTTATETTSELTTTVEPPTTSETSLSTSTKIHTSTTTTYNTLSTLETSFSTTNEYTISTAEPSTTTLSTLSGTSDLSTTTVVVSTTSETTAITTPVDSSSSNIETSETSTSSPTSSEDLSSYTTSLGPSTTVSPLGSCGNTVCIMGMTVEQFLLLWLCVIIFLLLILLLVLFNWRRKQGEEFVKVIADSTDASQTRSQDVNTTHYQLKKPASGNYMDISRNVSLHHQPLHHVPHQGRGGGGEGRGVRRDRSGGETPLSSRISQERDLTPSSRQPPSNRWPPPELKTLAATLDVYQSSYVNRTYRAIP